MKAYSLSVVMIIKNEADNLRLSLPALQGLADEIIILDSGSTDDSRQIAEQYGAKWYVNCDWPGFGKQRQLAQSYANGDWILALDADEVITPELKAEIQHILHQAPENTVYGIKMLDFFIGHQIDFPHWRIKAHWRLYPSNIQFNDNFVHEDLDLEQVNKKALQYFIHHHTAKSPSFWLEKRLNYAHAWAKQRQYKKNVSFIKIYINSYWAFIKQYFLDGRFLQGKYSIIYAYFFSQYTFNKYALLYAMNHHIDKQIFFEMQQDPITKENSHRELIWILLKNKFIPTFYFMKNIFAKREAKIIVKIRAHNAFSKAIIDWCQGKRHEKI